MEDRIIEGEGQRGGELPSANRVGERSVVISSAIVAGDGDARNEIAGAGEMLVDGFDEYPEIISAEIVRADE